MVIEVGLQVGEVGADAEYLEQLTLQLRQEILSLDVQAVASARLGAAPLGTKGVDAATLGALLVSVTPAFSAMSELVTALTQWLGRGSAQRTVRVKIGKDELELKGASSRAEQRLVDEWIRAHALE